MIILRRGVAFEQFTVSSSFPDCVWLWYRCKCQSAIHYTTHPIRKAPVNGHPISPTVSDFAMDESVIDLTHEVELPSHLTRSQASKSISSPTIAGLRAKLDAISVRSPGNHINRPPKSRRVFLSDSERENDEDPSTIRLSYVKTRGARSLVPTVHEGNNSQGDHGLQLSSARRYRFLSRRVDLRSYGR